MSFRITLPKCRLRPGTRILIIVSLPALIVSLVSARTARAQATVDNAFSTCTNPGSAGGIAPGTNLFRVEIDTTSFPTAVCNDGTPAVMYVREAIDPNRTNEWHIHLQGGGGCADGHSCARRWCSDGTNFGAQQMTSRGTPPGAGVGGIFAPVPANQFAGMNHVMIKYCSSDGWTGTVSDVELTTTFEHGAPTLYLINFQGHNIIDAALQTLRQSLGAVTYNDQNGVQKKMPNLDDADSVLVSGSSAGGGGAVANIDWIGDELRSTNNNCQRGDCPLVMKGVFDANNGRSLASRDWTVTPACALYGFCTYESFMTENWWTVHVGLRAGFTDESCTASVPAAQIGLCGDNGYVLENHVTTPAFVRADLQDNLVSGNYVEAGFGSRQDYGEITEKELRKFFRDDRSRGVFAPQCESHVGLKSRATFVDQTAPSPSGVGVNLHDALWQWYTLAGPALAVQEFERAGRHPSCP